MTLIPDILVFSGSKEMSMYFVIGFDMTSLTVDRISSIIGTDNTLQSGRVSEDICIKRRIMTLRRG